MSRPQEPYLVPAAPVPTDLALASNEGRPPRGLPAFDDLLDAECLARYPNVDELRARLAARTGVTPEQLLVTCGGDDAPPQQAASTALCFFEQQQHLRHQGGVVRASLCDKRRALSGG